METMRFLEREEIIEALKQWKVEHAAGKIRVENETWIDFLELISQIKWSDGECIQEVTEMYNEMIEKHTLDLENLTDKQLEENNNQLECFSKALIYMSRQENEEKSLKDLVKLMMEETWLIQLSEDVNQNVEEILKNEENIDQPNDVVIQDTVNNDGQDSSESDDRIEIVKYLEEKEINLKSVSNPDQMDQKDLLKMHEQLMDSELVNEDIIIVEDNIGEFLDTVEKQEDGKEVSKAGSVQEIEKEEFVSKDDDDKKDVHGEVVPDVSATGIDEKNAQIIHNSEHQKPSGEDAENKKEEDVTCKTDEERNKVLHKLLEDDTKSLHTAIDDDEEELMTAREIDDQEMVTKEEIVENNSRRVTVEEDKYLEMASTLVNLQKEVCRLHSSMDELKHLLKQRNDLQDDITIEPACALLRRPLETGRVKLSPLTKQWFKFAIDKIYDPAAKKAQEELEARMEKNRLYERHPKTTNLLKMSPLAMEMAAKAHVVVDQLSDEAIEVIMTSRKEKFMNNFMDFVGFLMIFGIISTALSWIHPSLDFNFLDIERLFKYLFGSSPPRHRSSPPPPKYRVRDFNDRFYDF